jgi:hypothetical protein
MPRLLITALERWRDHAPIVDKTQNPNLTMRKIQVPLQKAVARIAGLLLYMETASFTVVDGSQTKCDCRLAMKIQPLNSYH